jgi:hypothetical protein
MAIELKINSAFSTHTKTAQRLYEIITENTGTHMLDSGGSNGRNWQRNQGHTLEEWLERPSAILETEYGTYPTLDLFGFLNARLTLTERAQQFQEAFEVWLAEDSERSAFSCADMEDWVSQFHNSEAEFTAEICNSYNWENFLSQTIQYVNFEFQGETFVLLQVHGGADVRGGYTRPQVFETQSSYWAHDMQNATIQCTSPECKFRLDIQGTHDVFDRDGIAMTSSELSELKACPECDGTLEALAPEPTDY